MKNPSYFSFLNGHHGNSDCKGSCCVFVTSEREKGGELLGTVLQYVRNKKMSEDSHINVTPAQEPTVDIAAVNMLLMLPF